jgi:hypothetical protein
LGARLGIRKPAGDRQQGAVYLRRFLASAGQKVLSGTDAVREIPITVRQTQRDLVHDRKGAWLIGHFPSGTDSRRSPKAARPALPTQKDSGPRSP